MTFDDTSGLGDPRLDDAELDALVRDYYGDQVMNAEEISMIERAAREQTSGSRGAGSTARWSRPAVLAPLIALAAAAVLVLVFAGLPGSSPDASDAPGQMTHADPAGPSAANPLAHAATAAVEITSQPSGARIVLDGVDRGLTPQRIAGLSGDQEHRIRFMLTGYVVREHMFRVEPGGLVRVQVDLEPVAPVDPEASGPDPMTRYPECHGSGGRLSVMAIGESNCEVIVSGTSLGLAPFFKKLTPTGVCRVKVRCASGGFYQTELELRDGRDDKIIVREDMWQHR